MIGIINYKAGNLASVSNALQRLGAKYMVSDRIADLESADGIIFPGVGHAQPAMRSLRESGIDRFLKETDKPVLGICLGMQLLFESSEEGDSEGLGLLPGRLRKFDSSQNKVPHMGWNTFSGMEGGHPLLAGLHTGSFMYYVHSYYAPVGEYTVAACDYINEFSSVVARSNVMGTQFHPEKSGDPGEKLLQNFLDLTRKAV